MDDKIRIRYNGKYYTVSNKNGQRKNHSHIKIMNNSRKAKSKAYGIAKTLRRLIQEEEVPDSDFLKDCVLRVSLNKEYKQRCYDAMQSGG